MASSLRPQKVVVVGAGPVGALAALYAAERGDDVELYELRGDLRDASTIPLNFTKSINLAVSERGIHALRSASKIGLVDSIMHDTLPMYGRMIHGSSNGHFTETSQAYDVHGQAIYAADRSAVNKRLLDALDAMPNVKFFFNHKLTGADLKRKKAWFERRSTKDASGRRKSAQPNLDEDRFPELEVSFDLMVGADGAHSATRYHMMKFARVSYQQEYIDALWCEFHIEAKDGAFALSPNHLHIWPGRRFMFIAIPSTDRSFTCTLFAPQGTFSALDGAPETLEAFFRENFPGVYDRLIPAKELHRQFTMNPHLPLISIKCFPYHFDASCVILGDAAHAMVPFYGQGMNCGLEDVRVLFQFLDAGGVYDPTTEVQRTELRKEALTRYTAQRSPDAATMNDLALENYWVMRSGVTSPVYRLQKYVEELVTKYVPSLGFRTEYNRVSFGNERYSVVKEAVRRQEGIELAAIAVAGTGVLGLVAWMVVGVTRREHPVGLGFNFKWLRDFWR